MAKVRSILTISGNIGGMTFVDSKAYGPHARAPRGSITPVTLAEGMKTSSIHQQEANLRAKIIFDAVNEFAPGFKNGTFWSRLISIFRKQKKAGMGYSYGDFEELEMRYDYATSYHGKFNLGYRDGAIFLNYALKFDTGYRLSLLRIAADETLLEPFPSQALNAVLKEGEVKGSLRFDFTSLPKDTQVLYVLQCEQMLAGKLGGTLRSKSVRFFGRF